MLKNWLKIAFINYKKNWLSTFINLFGLTLGLTGFILMILQWNDEKSYESENPYKDQIFMVENDMGGNAGIWSSATYPQMRVPKEQIGDIEDYLLVNTWNSEMKIKYGSNFSSSKIFDSTPNFFSFFPFKQVAGNLNSALIEKNIALSDLTAKKLFGTHYKNAVGKSVKINDAVFTVSAIYKSADYNTVINPDAVMLPSYLKDNLDQWGNYSWSGFFKIKKGSDIDAVKQKIEKIIFKNKVEIPAKEEGMSMEEYMKAGYGSPSIFLTPLSKIKFDAKGSGINKADKKNIYILLSLSVLIVILSAINFINLKTAQSSQRAKEVGVRKAIGSGKGKIIVQFLLETAILSFMAYLLSLVLVELLLPNFNKFLGKQMEMNDLHVYLYSLSMVVLVTLVSGIVPAVYLSNFKPINTLKGNFSRSNHGIWLRNGILTLQLIISSFFIIGGLIINRQVSYMMDKDLGFNGNQAVIIRFNESNKKPYQKYKILKNEISKIPGVKDITYSKQVIGRGNSGSSNVDYKEEKKSIIATQGSIDLNFFKFYGIKFLAGRDFDPKLSIDTTSTAIVNEAFIKKMGWSAQQALEKEVQPGFSDKKYKLIGVTKDFNQNSVANEIEPSIFFNYGRNWNKNQVNNIQIKLDGNNIAETLAKVKQFWETEAESGFPMDYEFIDKKFAKTFEKYQKQQTLFTILNIVVLTVALLGLFALSSLLIEQKLKDVAIKKTLGASEKSIVLDLTKKFLMISAIAVLISIPISYYFMNEWLKDFAYRIEMPWLPYALSFVILLLLTFAVVSIKAYRATQVNLVKYLKYE